MTRFRPSRSPGSQAPRQTHRRLLAGVTLASALLGACHPEPRHEGLSLDQWLEVAATQPERRDEAETAFRLLGPGAALRLARRIAETPSLPQDPAQRDAVQSAFTAIGTAGNAAAPRLVEHLDSLAPSLPESREAFRFTLTQLGWIASEPETADALLRIASRTETSPDLPVLALTLARIVEQRNSDTRNRVLAALESDSPATRTLGALALALAGEPPEIFQPTLSQSLDSDDPSLVEAVLITLESLNL